jgi:hypothetical protein
VKANIANVLATKGKAASAAWARGVADIEKKVAAANR